MFPARLGKYFVGHRQSVRLEWYPCHLSFVFAASVAVTEVAAASADFFDFFRSWTVLLLLLLFPRAVLSLSFVVTVAVSVTVTAAANVLCLWLALLTRLSVATILLITIKTYNQLKVRIAEE
jgi:hypothetical protein